MTATMPTAEEFLVTPYPEEPDEDAAGFAPAFDLEPLEPGARDPLESIAVSLQTLTSIIERRDREDQEDDDRRQALDQADAEYAELQEENARLRQLLDDTLKICKPSTSKLANNIRALLEVDTVTAAAEEPETEGPMHRPANDAPVEEWRTYAKTQLDVSHEQYTFIDNANRSQIRTMLGIPQVGGA